MKAKDKLKEVLDTLDPNETIIHIHGWTKALSCSVFNIAYKMKFKVILTLHDYFIACPNGGFYNYKYNKICDYNPLSFKCIKCNCDSRNYLFKIYRVIRNIIQNKIIRISNKIDCAVSISDLSENVLSKFINKDVKISRIYNPIEKIEREINKQQIEKKYFVFVGRLDKEKGIEEFCEALDKTKCNGIVIGTGKLKEKLEKEYKNISFEGWKESKDVAYYMKNARALIFSSLWYETAGLTVLEAQSLKIPCIVNGHTAASEFILDDETGKIYNTIQELENIIINFDKYKFDFNKVNLDNFTEKEYEKKILNCYKEVLVGEKYERKN